MQREKRGHCDLKIRSEGKMPTVLSAKCGREIHKILQLSIYQCLEQQLFHDCWLLLRSQWEPWPGWFSWLYYQPVSRKVMGSIPSQGTSLSCGQAGAHMKGNLSVVFSLSFPLPPSPFSKIRKPCPQVRIKRSNGKMIQYANNPFQKKLYCVANFSLLCYNCIA